jgi:hypothetical protein
MSFGLESLAFGGLGGLLGNNSAPKAPAKLAKFMQALQAQNYALALQQARGGLASINQGYDKAINAAGVGGAQAKRDVLNMQKANLGAASQSAINRGLYNSSTLDTANRGVYSDAMRQMSDVNNALAQNMSNLQMARANALFGAKSNIANLFQNKAGADTSMLQNFWNQMPKAAAPNPLLAGIGQLGGAFLGAYTGGLGSGLANMAFQPNNPTGGSVLY